MATLTEFLTQFCEKFGSKRPEKACEDTPEIQLRTLLGFKRKVQSKTKSNDAAMMAAVMFEKTEPKHV